MFSNQLCNDSTLAIIVASLDEKGMLIKRHIKMKKERQTLL